MERDARFRNAELKLANGKTDMRPVNTWYLLKVQDASETLIQEEEENNHLTEERTNVNDTEMPNKIATLNDDSIF